MIGSDLFYIQLIIYCALVSAKCPIVFLQAHDTEITFIKFIYGRLFLVLVVVIF